MSFVSNALNFPNLPLKSTPISGDLIPLADSANGDTVSQTTVGDLATVVAALVPATFSTYANWTSSSAGDSVSIGASKNVSSITALNTLLQTINFTASYGSTTYTAVFTGGTLNFAAGSSNLYTKNTGSLVVSNQGSGTLLNSLMIF